MAYHMEPEDGGRKGAAEHRDLRVRLEEIPDSGLELEVVTGRELVAAYIPEEEIGFELLEPVRSRFGLSRRGRKVLVQGRVSTRLGLECDRCLARIEQPVDAQVEVTFVPHPEVEEGAQIELSEKDLEVEFYGPEPLLDLGEVIVEELALAVPYRVLCREACRGLCPRCGADLNREECRCEARPPDPRLAALKDFKIE
jgi:uncharacterized protein